MPRNDKKGKPPNEEKGRPRNDFILVIASEAKQSEGLDFQLRTSFRCRLDCFLLDV